MKTCNEIDAIMTAYVDGEVEADEAAAVRDHLAECPPCRERASVESTARKVLHARAVALSERAPAALRARCVAAVPSTTSGRGRRASVGWWQRVSGWVPLSMAATVLLAIGAVLVLGQNERLEAAFAAQLALDHDRCFTHLEGVLPDFDQRQAEMRLAGDHGLDVAMPPESADFDLIDVRQCLYDDGEMAHVLCEWHGEPVSLYVVPDRSDGDQILEIVGHDAVIWSQNDNAYVLVAETGPIEIGKVVQYVRQYTD